MIINHKFIQLLRILYRLIIEMNTCLSFTLSGKRCSKKVKGSEYCFIHKKKPIHQNEEYKEKSEVKTCNATTISGNKCKIKIRNGFFCNKHINFDSKEEIKIETKVESKTCESFTKAGDRCKNKSLDVYCSRHKNNPIIRTDEKKTDEKKTDEKKTDEKKTKKTCESFTIGGVKCKVKIKDGKYCDIHKDFPFENLKNLHDRLLYTNCICIDKNGRCMNFCSGEIPNRCRIHKQHDGPFTCWINYGGMFICKNKVNCEGQYCKDHKNVCEGVGCTNRTDKEKYCIYCSFYYKCFIIGCKNYKCRYEIYCEYHCDMYKKKYKTDTFNDKNIEYKYNYILTQKEREDVLLAISFYKLEKNNLVLGDINKKYRKLAIENHPDKGGDVEIFKKILCYKEVLEKLLS